MRTLRTRVFALMAFALFFITVPRCHSEGALLLEQPYGFFGALNPTGHTAIYFQDICAETPVKLRRCMPGETGSVISRYQGIGGWDWIAVPLVPYLYSVEDARKVPAQVTKEQVRRLRSEYHEARLQDLGSVPEGGFLHGGWTELIGVAYERRIYAFRFATTEEQDDAFIEKMNGAENRAKFQLLFNNCADFARVVLNEYFPGTFRRSIFPDAGMTTPKQLTYKLIKYARKHPETELAIFEISQVPGNRRLSKANKNIAESLITTGYAVPIVVLNPYLAGGLFVDYLVRGRAHLLPKDLPKLTPDRIASLTAPDQPEENPASAAAVATRAAAPQPTEAVPAPAADTGPKEPANEHE